MKKAMPEKKPVEILELAKHKFVRFHLVIFVAFIALVYGYLFWQINNFNNAKPNPLQITNHQTSPAAKIPRIDPTTVKKIQQLKDNSVNVQGLFNKARKNPFSQ